MNKNVKYDEERKRVLELLISALNKRPIEDFLGDLKYKRFYRKLYLNCLRHVLYTDKLIEKYVKNPPALDVRGILCLGVTQILFMDDVPDYAAVDETVNLTAITNAKSNRGFVNWFLRQIIRDKKKLLQSYKAIDDFPQFIIDSYKNCNEDIEKIFETLNTAPKHTCFSIKENTIVDFETGHVNSNKYLPMDRSSIEVARLTLLLPEEPKKILDACAAPGGKSIVISVEHPSSEIDSYEISISRYEMLLEYISKYSFNNNITAYNDDFLNSQDNKYDLVLLDAPCSSFGTIRKHPEIRITKDEKDITRMATKQKFLLTKAIEKSHKYIIFSVCSTEKEETIEILDFIKKSYPDLKIIKIEGKEYYIKYAYQDKGDGFFSFILEK